MFFENVHSILSPISENDYTQHSPMFQLGQNSPTRNEFEGLENDTLRSDPPTPIYNCFGRQMPREYATDSDPLVHDDIEQFSSDNDSAPIYIPTSKQPSLAVKRKASQLPPGFSDGESIASPARDTRKQLCVEYCCPTRPC